MRRAIKINNSYLEDKIIIRLENLPAKKSIKVLECFGGENKIWQEVKVRSKGIEISVDSVDKFINNNSNVTVDTYRILPSINPNDYDIIDVDCWGSPYKALKIIFSRPGFDRSKVIIFYTKIQMYGLINKELFLGIGITEKQYKKSRIIFARFAEIAFDSWLYKNGYREKYEKIIGKKCYGVLK